METVFSEFYYEYIKYDPRAARHEDQDGHDVCFVPGVGTCSGRDYSLVLVDGRIDDRRTRKY